MSKPYPSTLFALKAWTVKQHGDKFYIAPTAGFDDRLKWSRGYASLQAACAGIARKLAEEWLARSARSAALRTRGSGS